MKLAREIQGIIRMEWLMEMRSLHTAGGILVYLLSAIFILYGTFLMIGDPELWNALMWLIILFVAVNATARSFLQEPEGRWHYIYQLTSARGLILGRMIYQGFFLSILSLTVYGLFSVLFGNPVVDNSTYMVALVLGSWGFAAVFTLMSAIAGKAGQGTTLVAILGFPVIIPLLISVLKITNACLESALAPPDPFVMLALLLIDLLVIALSLVLFPYLWAD